MPDRVAAAETPDPEDAVEQDWLREMHFEELDSTQGFVEREHRGFDQAKLTVVSADFQTAGRGTRDRTWEAVRAKSVLATYFFRFPAECQTAFVNSKAPIVTKVLALATIDTLQWATGGQSGVEFGIKWPNDVMANGRKIAGVLASSVLSPEGRLDGIVIGVGVNINQTQAEMDAVHRPVWQASSLRAITGDDREFDVAAVRRRLNMNFAKNLKLFFAEGFAAFRDRVNAAEIFMGSQVRFRVSTEEEIDGTFDGVDDEGHIVIVPASGLPRSFPAGEIIPGSLRPCAGKPRTGLEGPEDGLNARNREFLQSRSEGVPGTA